ncbi:pilus (MSHA type) biogenesis protein MshL [Aquincola sp. S2]|uniref:Pilus (MSHA type) biogenesis protein MshL n=1 Tax=Pseudaquabacterium terrae TaxID=2732868 RepID=A0ABX2EQX1_9BURK|nr:pilus (MSHA type) biogenesis protein MshL [Aquabacterium terrae]NRF71115.1 pilus (MSHA type) biogenesis protein MshL [Aquabacterium terrae]
MAPRRLLAACALLALSAGAAALDAPPPAGSQARFDLSVNNAPAAQVFLQLGAGTPYSMLVSPEVAGNVTLTLKDTTLLEALESLRELYGYEFRVAGNRIHVQPNTVQTRLFRINYLSGRREGASDIRVTSSSMSQGGSTPAGSAAGATGSGSGAASTQARNEDTARVRTTSDADFWREVRASLAALVGSAEQRSVVINPAAGVIVVRAAPAELRQVQAYLAAMQLSIERQVMLEAKIVSVELSQGAQSGVNWAAFGSAGSGRLSIGAAAPGATLAPKGSPISDGINTLTAGAGLAAEALGKGFYGLAFQASNFAAMLNFLETQGNVQVLSSPRIATLNNQKAVLKVGSDELFVTGVSTTTTTNAAGGTVSTPSLSLQAFFSGVALDVTPQIDDAGNVMLHVHPTISSVSEKTKHVDLGALGSFRLPLALSAVSETDSIVRMRDGQIVAIGGLMTQELRDDRSGVPGVSGLPIIGGLFRQKTGSLTKRELVILIKPSVIADGGAWPEADVSMSAAGR